MSRLLGWDLHNRFWRNYLLDGHPPARALLNARREYIANVTDDPASTEVERRFADAAVMKNFFSATCLGLGW